MKSLGWTGSASAPVARNAVARKVKRAGATSMLLWPGTRDRWCRRFFFPTGVCLLKTGKRMKVRGCFKEAFKSVQAGRALSALESKYM